MTCCIGYKTDKMIYFVADTAGTDDGGAQETRSDLKVFKIKNILFAVSGSFRMRDILMYNLELPKRNRRESTDKYIHCKLINSIREILIDNGACIKTDESENTCPGEILIGIDNRIYKIESDFQIGETNRPYNVIGSGFREASAALDMYHLCKNTKTITDEEIKDMFSKVFDITANRNTSVNNIIHLESIEIK